MKPETGGAGRVLVVDDDRVQLLLVRRLLERAGYRVETMADGESCLAALAGPAPDAVVLDLHMPGMTGSETLERILARHPHMPVVMLSGDVGVERVVAAVKAGAFDYLGKPVDEAALVRVVSEAVAHGRAGGG